MKRELIMDSQIGVRWKELEVKIQMGNTMGAVSLNIRTGEFRTLIEVRQDKKNGYCGSFFSSLSRDYSLNNKMPHFGQ